MRVVAGSGNLERAKDIPLVNGRFNDKVGVPGTALRGDYQYTKTEQTFTVQKGGTVYYLSTKVNQYILVQNGVVRVGAVVVVP